MLAGGGGRVESLELGWTVGGFELFEAVAEVEVGFGFGGEVVDVAEAVVDVVEGEFGFHASD